MKFAYKYRRSVAFALYIALLTTTALPAAMARPIADSSGKVTGVRSARAATTTASLAAQKQASSPPKRDNKGMGRLIPSWVTARSTKGVKGFAGSSRLQVGGTFGSNVQEQVVDVTNVTDTTLGNLGVNDERHPFWTADEQVIYYSSNQAGGNYQLWRIPSSTNSVVTGATVDTGAQVITTEAGAIHDFPAINQAGNRIAYIKSTDNGATFHLYQTPVPATGQTITPQGASEALTLNKTVGADTIRTVGRPSWLSGTEIVVDATFTNDTKDLIVVDFQTRSIRRLTTGTAAENNAAVSPDGNYVAFDSDATGYNGSASSGTGTTRNVFVVNSVSGAVTQITNAAPTGSPAVAAANVSSVQPAWSRSGVVPIFNTSTTYYLAFASDRQTSTTTPPTYVRTANGTHDIYYVPAVSIDPATQVRTLTPETTGASALKLDTRDTNRVYDDQYPTWPALLNIQRLGFQSNRKGSSATTFTPTPAGTNDLFVATLIDITAPTLLRYDLSNDAGEIVHINSGSTYNRNASVRSRADGITPGSTLFFTVRAEDLESGVKSVYLQFKNPNSKYQAAAQGGRAVEHKEYNIGTADVANNFEAPFVRYEALNGAGFPLLLQPFAGFGNFNPTPLNLGQEYEAEVVSAANSQQNGTAVYFQHILNRNVANAPFNNAQFPGMYEAGISDLGAFSGSANPAPLDPAFNPTTAELGTDAAEKQKGVWLKLDALPAAQQDGNGGTLYGASWKIPADDASDWYIDVVIYDNAVNPFDVNGGKFNWIIYDNVWGFSSGLGLNADQVDVLFVSDYGLGQKFAYTRFGDPTASAGLNTNTVYNLPNQIFGVESYYTDRDFSDWLDGSRAPDPPATTQPTDPRIWDSQGAFRGHPGSGGTDALQGTGALSIYNPLGYGSFVDPTLIQDSVSVSETTKGSNRNLTVFRPSTGRYSIWRILSRGPLPLSILNDYLPIPQTRPPDTRTNPATGQPYETTAQNISVVSRAVVWASPFTLTTFHGPGTITDLQTQQSLAQYVQNGGKLFVSGQDIAFALGNGSSLLTQVFGAQFIADTTGGARVLTLTPNTGTPVAARLMTDAFGGARHSYSESTATIPTYSPPSSGPLELMTFRLGSAPNADYRGDASFSSPSVENAPNFAGFLDQIQPSGANAQSLMTYTGVGSSAMVYNQYGAGEVVFASFGFEGLGNGWYNWAPQGSTVTRIANHSRRAEIMHNITCAFRTGFISGRIVDQNGAPVSDAVVYVAPSLAALAAGRATSTGLTDTSGNYTVFGLPAGSYIVQADRAGYYRQTSTGNTIHGAGRATVNLILRSANPGRLAGVQYTAATASNKPNRPKIGTTNIPQGGVFRTDDKTGLGDVPVLAYRTEATNTGVRYVGFLGRTSTGDTNNSQDYNLQGRLLQVGEYEFPQQIPTGDYKVICNPQALTVNGLNGGTPLTTIRDQSGNVVTTVSNYKSTLQTVEVTSATQTNIDLQPDDPSTTINEATVVTAAGLVTIESDKTAGIDFRLATGPQSITGQVLEDNADGSVGGPIRGATVTATLGSTLAGSATTDANGNFTLTATDGSTLFAEGTYTITVTVANGYDLVAEPTGRSKRPSITVLVGGDSSVPVRLVEPVNPNGNPPTYGALLLEKLPPGSVSGLVARLPGLVPTQGATVNVYNSDAAGNKLDADGDASNGVTPAYTTVTTTAQTNGTYQYNYIINNVNTGTYVAEASLRGYSSNPLVSAVFTITSGNETRNINFILESPKIYGIGVQLISIPIDYTATSAYNNPRQLFGLPDSDATFNIARWAAEQTVPDYVYGANIALERGRGYFVRFADATPLTNNEGVAFNGNTFDVTLYPGWNLIGHPFARLDNPYAVPANIDLVNGTRYVTAQGDLSYDEAIARGYIRGVAYGYTGSTSNSQYFQASTLQPYLGYWYRNTSTETITMRISRPSEATRSVKVGKTGAALTRAEQEKTRFRSIDSKGTTDWRLQIAVRQGDLLDTDNSVGVSPNAKDGFDTQYDTEKPPVMTEADQVYLAISGKNETGRATTLADDIRSASQSGVTRTWDLSVKPAAGKGDVTVFWPNVNRLPRGIEPYLVDVASGKRIPIRYASSYTYTPSSEEMGGRAVHQLRIEVAKPTSIPFMLTGVRQTQIGTRAAGSRSTRIAFTVTREADVTAEFQTLGGKVVNQIQSRARASRESAIVWNGRSADGTQLPAGTYILKLTAKDSNGATVTVRKPITSLQ